MGERREAEGLCGTGTGKKNPSFMTFHWEGHFLHSSLLSLPALAKGRGWGWRKVLKLRDMACFHEAVHCHF